ncbi:MAG TPA: DNA internalization-related competence protein ComEC/Rec2 [Cellvibrio sp.]|nr:DNA internalization-related competence protein ComEC/Rec2 [Cellvibrio sp.]
MPVNLLLFSFGVIAASYFPLLPPLWCLFLLAPLVPLCWKWRVCRYFLAVIVGVAWGVFCGHHLVDMQLADELTAKDLIVKGQVQGLPEQDDRRLRFNFRVISVTTSGGRDIPVDQFPSKLQLSWYQFQRSGKSTALPSISVGDSWQLRVRLKRPRGFANPAGFDYQAWLLRQGIGATGYVVDGPVNQLLPAINQWRWDDWIDQQRHRLQQWIITHSDSNERSILVALLIGDSGLVDKEQWTRMQRTGTSHLIAISGLHVGFLAIFGFYAGLFLGKCIHLFCHRCPALFIAWWSAVVCASFYSALAGFNIPTIRTLIMLAVFYFACIWRRSIRIGDIFSFALALVVLIDPLAALDMGFWLSFGAVALLLFYFSGRLVPKKLAGSWSGFSVVDVVTGFARSQWVMFIGLLVPLSVLVSSISLVAPVANAVAIPLITFIVVPLLLISASTRNLFESLSDFLLNGAAWVMEAVKLFLDALLQLGGAWSSPVVAFSPTLAVLIGVSCLLLLMPKGLFPRMLGWSGLLSGLVLSFFAARPNQPDLQLTVLDVGQGTSVVVQVGKQTLVYDTGPKYSDNFDAGSGIVAPYLNAQGITRIDRLVVSHSDMDHSGGMTGLLDKMPADQIFAGEPQKMPQGINARNCHQGFAWEWQSVTFRFLEFPQLKGSSVNNHSCVLLISYRDQHILLPGDVETSVENQLLRTQQLPQKINVLLVAHHGSRTSSGLQFVNYTQPDVVIYSAGFRSQHGHPHKDVRKRFQAVGSREINTAEAGAVVFEWKQGRLDVVREYRNFRQRYWFD